MSVMRLNLEQVGEKDSASRTISVSTDAGFLNVETTRPMRCARQLLYRIVP
jgi:hypothetical protein